MKIFKIRSSATGKIMTMPRSKAAKEAGELSATAKTYCQEWVKEQLYGRRKEFSNKYTEKGLIVEDNSIDYMAEKLKYGFLIKNETFFENDFLTGTPDVILPDVVIDVKNSFDCFTFPLFEKLIPNKDYEYQLQSYMALTDRNNARLVYTLMDTPTNIIEREAFYWCKNNGFEELDDVILQQFYKKMTFTDIPDDLKIKVFEIERNEETIKQIEQQVLKCRNYIETLI